MAFQIKAFADIVISMMNWMKGTQNIVTDFNEGAVARTMVEAPAAELDELYQQMLNGLIEAIPVATYNSFQFAALPANDASGLVRVVITSSAQPTVISAGTVLSYPGSTVTYTSQADVTIPAGNTYGDVLAVANTIGSAGNITGTEPFTLTPTPSGFVSAANLAPFINGFDAETPEARQIRFNAFIAALPRGTPVSLSYGLSTVQLTDSLGNVTERVASSAVVEPYETDNTKPPALIQCYIHNGVGSTSSALITQAQKVLYGYIDANGNKVPGWKAAGVHVDVYAATEIPLNIGGTLTVLPGYDEPTVEAAANAAAAAYIVGIGIGQPFQENVMVKAIMAITGVGNFVAADVPAPVAPVLGQIAGGALAAQIYYVQTTYVTPAGETLPNAIVSLAVSANNVLTVASPALIAGVTGWNVYVGTTPANLQKQNSTLLGIGTGYTEPVSGLVAGAAPPTISTARLADIATSQTQKLMPGTMSIS
ncbi:MAG TPA: baseplate J/gp47 family protein [Paraburkholderia sp.]